MPKGPFLVLYILYSMILCTAIVFSIMSSVTLPFSFAFILSHLKFLCTRTLSCQSRSSFNHISVVAITSQFQVLIHALCPNDLPVGSASLTQTQSTLLAFPWFLTCLYSAHWICLIILYVPQNASTTAALIFPSTCQFCLKTFWGAHINLLLG